MDVLKPPDIHQPSHMVTDLLFWKNQYRLLASASHEHNRAIEKVMDNTNKYLARIRLNGAPGKEERTFCREVRLYQNMLRLQMDKLQNDSAEYYKLEQNLKRFSDDPALRVVKLDSFYRASRDKVNAQTKVVEDIKKDYHKSMFAVEKANINEMLAISDDAIHDVSFKLEDLKVKTDKHVTNYNKQLEKWHIKFDRLSNLSVEFEAAYKSREEARAKKIISVIQKSVELTNTTLVAKKEPDFSHIDGGTIILEKVIKHEAVSIPCFEDYVPQEDTTQLYARARAEIDEGGKDRTLASRSEDLWSEAASDGSKESIEDKLAANRKLKNLRNTRLQLVNKAYKKQSVNQISLKVGEHVKQLLPENEDGLAFGEVLHGLLHKKKRGFYPVANVTLEDNTRGCHDNAEDAEHHRGRKSAADRQSLNGQTLKRRQENGNDKRRHSNGEKSDNADANPEFLNDTANMRQVFSSFSEKLRRRKRRDSKIEVVVERVLSEDLQAEPEHTVTAVHAFVAEPDSDDDDVYEPPGPRLAFQDPGEEASSPVHTVARGQPMTVGGNANANARRRRREVRND